MLAFRFSKTAGGQGVAAGNAGDICHCAAATVGIESDGILGRGGRRVLPQRLDCDVSGDGHRGVHRILRTVYLPCLELLVFRRNKLALRQRILAAVQYLLSGHCGGDLLGQLLRLGAAVSVKSDGMLVAHFKRCGDGNISLRLDEGIGIVPNRNGGRVAVDGQRAEHIALVGGDGEHDRLVLVEQGCTILGGSRGVHHLDTAVFTSLSRYPVLRRTLHCHTDCEILLPFLSRTCDNIKPRFAAHSGAFQNHRSVDRKGLLPLGLRIIVLRDLPRNLDRYPTGGVSCINPDLDLGELFFQILFPGNTDRLRRRHIPMVLLPHIGQVVPENPERLVGGHISAGVFDDKRVLDAVVILCRDRINAIFIRRQKLSFPTRGCMATNRDGR